MLHARFVDMSDTIGDQHPATALIDRALKEHTSKNGYVSYEPALHNVGANFVRISKFRCSLGTVICIQVLRLLESITEALILMGKWM